MAEQKNDAPGNSGLGGEADTTQTITYVFPSSGQNTNTNTVIVGGTNLTGVNGVYFGTEYCYITEYAPDGTLLTVQVTPNKQVGSVRVTAGSASLYDGYEFLRSVVGYRAFAKWSSDGDTWQHASHSKLQKRVPGQTSYSLPLVKDDGSPLANAHDATSVVWKITMCAMLDETKMRLLDPDPAVQNQSDNQYPPPGNRGLVIWQTKQACMPCNLKITALSPGSAVLSWSPAPEPMDDNYRITGYRVFRKPQAQSEWISDQRWFDDTTDTKMVVRAGSQPYSYTVLPKARRTHDPQDIVFGTNASNVPFPDDQSNMVLNYGSPKLLAQYPSPYGQVFVLQDSIRSASIMALFDHMQGLENSKNAYQWQKATVDYPDANKSSDWANVAVNMVALQGQNSPVLSFGAANYPTDMSLAGWYRLRARNGASGYNLDVFSSPVRVYIGTQGDQPTPALSSQSFLPADTTYTEPKTQGQLALIAQFNNTTGAAYSWGWSKTSPTGPYSHSGVWWDIGGSTTRKLWFGDGTTAGADSKDSGWYRLQVEVSGKYAYSDPVYVKIGKGGDPKRESSKNDWHIVEQYPAGGQNIDVPMDATSDALKVSIAAYPNLSEPRLGWEHYYALGWERMTDGHWWTDISDEDNPNAFPSNSDVSGKNSTVLLFTPHGDFADYSKRVSGWYRLKAYDRESYREGNWFSRGGNNRIEAARYSEPVQVTVVEAGQGKPQLLDQSRGIYAGATGSFGINGVSIGANFSNMDGVGNGYRWQYNKSNPPATGWTDAIPAKETVVGLGTPTLDFGVSAVAGAQPASFGWYRLTATNEFGSASSDPVLVSIYDLQHFGAPTITGISPSVGPATGGTTVTITGTNLLGATAVLFTTNPSENKTLPARGWNIVANSDKELTVITPAQLPKKALVTVYTPLHPIHADAISSDATSTDPTSTDAIYFTFT